MAGNPDDRIRAFLAVEVPPATHEALVALKRELAQSPADVRWVRDDALHATLKFLGSVDAGTLDGIRAALEPVADETAPCAIRVRGLGAFPNLRRPRVLWVGMESEGLPPLAARVDAVTARFGFEPESRPFAAHITLGRVRSPRGWPRLEEWFQAHLSDDFGAGIVAEIVAFRSDLRPAGAVYTKLWTAPLNGRTEGDPHGR